MAVLMTVVWLCVTVSAIRQWLEHTSSLGDGAARLHQSCIVPSFTFATSAVAAELVDCDCENSDMPPPPDPKVHPGGKTGGLVDRVVVEVAATAQGNSSEDEPRVRRDGLVMRILSAL